MGMGTRLVSAQHFASDQIKKESAQLEAKWERLRGVVNERVELFDLSVSFHETQQKVYFTMVKCRHPEVRHSI